MKNAEGLGRVVDFTKRWAILSVLILSTFACALLQPEVPAGAVLFQDDFSRPSSGWDRYRDDVFQADYVNGAYRITIFSPETEAWSRPHLQLSDVSIDVVATKVDGPDDNLYGVLCRYQNADNFYFFVISSDGYIGIGKHLDGRQVLLSHDTMQPNLAVQRGDSSNLIRVECIGDSLRLSINGVLAASVQDREWQEGDVGLLAGAYEQAGVEIEFDNFSVQKP